MKVRNNSNYRRKLEEVWIEPGEVETLDVEKQRVKRQGDLEIVEDESTSENSGGKGGDTEETSKPTEQKDEEGDD